MKPVQTLFKLAKLALKHKDSLFVPVVAGACLTLRPFPNALADVFALTAIREIARATGWAVEGLVVYAEQDGFKTHRCAENAIASIAVGLTMIGGMGLVAAGAGEISKGTAIMAGMAGTVALVCDSTKKIVDWRDISAIYDRMWNMPVRRPKFLFASKPKDKKPDA